MKNRMFTILSFFVTLTLLIPAGLQVVVASNGSTWITELVDDAGDVGIWPSLALDLDDYPHIAYYDRTNGDLKYAYYDEGQAAWHSETVHSSGDTGVNASLAIDTNGNPHIAWLHGTPSWSLMYGYHDGTMWHIENVSPGSWPGGGITLALDSNNHPHISYHTDIDGGPNANSLMYARHDGASWHIERVDGPSLHGMCTFLVLDSLDHPHIAYWHNSDGSLRYAWYNGAWQIEVVHTDSGYSTVSLALDSSDHPHIAYQNRIQDALEYFWKDDDLWHRETVDSSVHGDDLASIALDSLDNAHISYTDYDGMDYYVTYAYQDGSVWQTEAVASGITSRLALDSTDAPHISYYDQVAGELWYASGSDPTPPMVNVSFPPPDGQNGWFVTSPVIGSVTANDTTTGGSNITAINCTGATVGPITGLGTPSASAILIVSTEGVNNVSCTATDSAGNSGAGAGSNNTATVQIDTVAPAVLVTSPADGGSYLLNAAVASSYTCADATSSVATCDGPVASGVNFSTSPVGAHAFMVTATDVAGNQAQFTNHYTITYDFSGFFPPVDNPPTLNDAKAGKAIPVKFSLNGDQGMDIFDADFPTSQQIACDTSAPLDDIEETTTAGSSSLSYDATIDQYVYVWKTDKGWADTCRQLIVQLNDGTAHVAYFSFR